MKQQFIIPILLIFTYFCGIQSGYIIAKYIEYKYAPVPMITQSDYNDLMNDLSGTRGIYND